MGEIGKNMTVYECGPDMLVVDAGLAFPEEELLGVDIVIPDFSYVLENRSRIRGVILTHGHEDHMGAIPYLLRQVEVPVFGSRLALGLVREKLSEHGLDLPPGSRSFEPGEEFRIGCFRVEPFLVNHSIADAVGLALHTPVGTVVHTGDFKFDQTPVDGRVADFHRLAYLGTRGVLLLLSDSTNADRPGYTPSEKVVGETLDTIVAMAPGRVLVATFATNIHRIQQVFDCAARRGRKVAVVGRSVENTVQVALELGYLRVEEGVLVGVEELRRYSPEKICILTTGTQGEPMSALSRMATGEHRWVEIIPGDTVVIAATPVPGNEYLVHRTVDNLFRLGAKVIHGRESGVHVSGHGSQEELKLMLNLIRPRYFIPVHGQYRHLVRHAELAQAAGVPAEGIMIGENGTTFEVTAEGCRIAGKTPAGKVMVDGFMVGDVGTAVLRDRRQLAGDGILIVVLATDKSTGAVLSGPELISRGFVYEKGAGGDLLEEAKPRVLDTIARCRARQIQEWQSIKRSVRDSLSSFIYDKTRRRPVIVPVILEV